jgi:hypothetical protein
MASLCIDRCSVLFDNAPVVFVWHHIGGSKICKKAESKQYFGSTFLRDFHLHLFSLYIVSTLKHSLFRFLWGFGWLDNILCDLDNYTSLIVVLWKIKVHSTQYWISFHFHFYNSPWTDPCWAKSYNRHTSCILPEIKLIVHNRYAKLG